MASRKLFVLAVALALLLAPWDPGRANTIGIYPPGSISTAVQFYTNPGDTVLVYPGVYINESGALVDHAVTVIGVGGAANNEVRICTDLCQAILFNINMPSGTVLIDGLTMTRDRQWPGDAYGLHVYGSGSVTVRNCVFRELRQDGIVSGGPAYLRVEGCLFLRTQGVTLYTSNAELAGNTFSESGIYLTNSASPLIRRNIFFRCSDNLICDFPSAPILECNDTWASLWRRCDPGVENGNFGADRCSATGKPMTTDFRVNLHAYRPIPHLVAARSARFPPVKVLLLSPWLEALLQVRFASTRIL